MAEPVEDREDWIVTHLDVSHLTTENDEPVDNFYQERQMDILTEALRVSWEEGKPFVQGADIGVFSRIDQEAVVPDVMLATGVEMPEDVMAKERRSYFIWNFGKPPDIVIEIVSNITPRSRCPTTSFTTPSTISPAAPFGSFRSVGLVTSKNWTPPSRK
ncbi:MAG: hypothetical protein WC423_01625 [Vulcanimicrobiota bacterium]